MVLKTSEDELSLLSPVTAPQAVAVVEEPVDEARLAFELNLKALEPHPVSQAEAKKIVDALTANASLTGDSLEAEMQIKSWRFTGSELTVAQQSIGEKLLMLKEWGTYGAGFGLMGAAFPALNYTGPIPAAIVGAVGFVGVFFQFLGLSDSHEDRVKACQPDDARSLRVVKEAIRTRRQEIAALEKHEAGRPAREKERLRLYHKIEQILEP